MIGMQRFGLTKVVSILFLALVVGLSACSKGTENNDPAKGASQGIDNEKQWVIKFDAAQHRPKAADDKNPVEKKALLEINKEYEALHPNVKIEFYDVPSEISTERLPWLQARMMAKDAPDIFVTNFEMTWDHYKKGWFLPFDEWLNKPSPYNDNKKWGDTYVPGMLDSIRAPDGKVYVLPTDGVGVTIFYNKKIFDDLKLSEPKTWKEFMEIQEKILASGVTPFAYTSQCCIPSWVDALLLNQFMVGNIDKLDEDKNNRVDPIEIAHATKNGLMPNKEILAQELTLWKDWSKYWPKGFNTEYDYNQMFATGKVAMVFGGSWSFTSFDSMKLPFEYGTFNFPTVTKESASLSTEKGAKILGPWGPAQWLVPGYLAETDPDKIPVIMDYLMFLSKPENISKLDLESGFEPNIVGAQSPPGHDVFQEDLPILVIQHFEAFLGQSFGEKYNKALQLYLNGSIDLDNFLGQLEQFYKQGAEETITAQQE